MDPNEEWLQKRLVEYCSNKNDMYESIEELSDMDELGHLLPQALNGRYLRRFCSSVWQEA